MAIGKKELENVLAENEVRRAAISGEYDPMRGIGCYGERRKYSGQRWGENGVWLPVAMVEDENFSWNMKKSDYMLMRFRYDFEYWCACCVKIMNKKTHRMDSFVLNRAQRKFLGVLERQRCSGRPVRVIVLKARQWGASTLTQIYMAWWQLVLFENCDAVIGCHHKDTSHTIQTMYNRLLDNYPCDD